MDRSKIDATLDLLTAEELADVDRFVEVWERAGYMSPAEAAAWRERTAIWCNLPDYSERLFHFAVRDGIRDVA